MRLAIITTHPIQYYAPMFKLLNERGNINIKVFYTWGENALNKYDPGFNKTIKWDIPLLDGYSYEWVQNTSTYPGSHHYKGIINPELISQIKKWQPDAVLVYGWAYHSHLKVIRHFKNKVPVLFRGDSTLLDEQKGVKNLIKSILLKWVYRHIDHAFYAGTNNKNYFKKYGLKENQLSFAPHAIDNFRFGADNSDDAILLRKKLAIPDHHILILFSGKLEEKKSPELLLDAFLSLKDATLHLLFLGNGVFEEKLKSKAASVQNIHFMEFQNQSVMPSIYQACDLFCLPSKGPGETWGLAVNEAMACGKAVLVSDKVGCSIDLVKNEYNGMIFKSGNLEDLSEKLNKLTTSKDLLRQYGAKSRELIMAWNFSKIAEAVENKLKALS